MQEHDVLGVIRWLTRFAGPQTPESAVAAPSEAPSDLQRAVQKGLDRLFVRIEQSNDNGDPDDRLRPEHEAQATPGNDPHQR